jgi:hypothetical protein
MTRIRTRAASSLVALAACGRFGFSDRVGSDAAMTVDAMSDGAAPHAIAFRQAAGVQNAPGEDATINFSSNVHAGDTLIVAVDVLFSDPTTFAINDTQGNPFTVAVGPGTEVGYAQVLAYAVAASDGPDAITVSPTTIDPAYDIELRILDYAGISTTGAVDVTASAFGSNPGPQQLAAPPLTTTGPDEMLVVFCVGHTGRINASAGYTARSTFDMDLVSDEPAPIAGMYVPTAEAAINGDWTLMAAAFR